MRIALPARRESLELARRALLDQLAASSLPPPLVYRLELVLEEVLMNIVWHAYGDSGEGEFVIEAERTGDDVKLVFEDHGPAFDPTEAVPAEAPHDLQEARVGGLGLVLMRRFANDVNYEREGKTNRLEVRLRA